MRDLELFGRRAAGAVWAEGGCLGGVCACARWRIPSVVSSVNYTARLTGILPLAMPSRGNLIPRYSRLPCLHVVWMAHEARGGQVAGAGQRHRGDGDVAVQDARVVQGCQIGSHL